MNRTGHPRRVPAIVTAAAVALSSTFVLASTSSAESGFTFSRYAGSDRYDTAARIATDTFPTSPVVVLASGVNFPDALAATYAAGVGNAPILLVGKDTVPAPTGAALTALGATKALIVGGKDAVGDGVETALKARSIAITRVAGATRYETSKLLAGGGGSGAVGPATVGSIDGAKTAIVVSGETFPDALSAGPIAFAAKVPVLLTTVAGLSPETKAALTDLGIKSVLLVGGTSAVSPATESAISAMGIKVTRIAGADRSDTAALVADFELAKLGFDPSAVFLASGAQFADALAGAVHAGARRMPTLLAGTNGLGEATFSWLSAHAGTLRAGQIAGGTSAVSDPTESSARAAATGTAAPGSAEPDPAGGGTTGGGTTGGGTTGGGTTGGGTTGGTTGGGGTTTGGTTTTTAPPSTTTTAPPAASGPITVTGADEAKTLLANRLTFGTVKNSPVTKAVTLKNTSSSPISVTNVAVSPAVIDAEGDKGDYYRVPSSQPTSFTLAAGATAPVSVEFAPAQTSYINDATLTITTNSSAQPTIMVALGGVNPSGYEGNAEPPLDRIVRAMGYATSVGPHPAAGHGNTISSSHLPVGDEVISPYWRRVDGSQPVHAEPLARYGGRNSTGGDNFGWAATDGAMHGSFNYPADPAADPSVQPPAVDTTTPYAENQKLFPGVNGSKDFSPSDAVFGLFGNGNIYSDDVYNGPGREHSVRMFPAMRADRSVIANAWLLALDAKVNTPDKPNEKNFDYQEQLVLLTNIQPANGAPSGTHSATSLDFSSTGGTVLDKDNQGTGFTSVMPNSAGNQYVPANIDIDTSGNGVLRLKSSAGAASNGQNTQQNALRVAFDGTRPRYQIQSRLFGPFTNLTQGYQHEGIFFGPDQDNFVKLEVEHNGDGSDPNSWRITFFAEQNGSGAGTSVAVSIGSTDTIDLRLEVDAVTGYITGSYSLDSGDFQEITTSFRPSAAGNWCTSQSYAGVLVSNEASATQITGTFDSFGITTM